jgi:hypothetical protein
MAKRKRIEGKPKYGGYWIDKIANHFKDKQPSTNHYTEN